MRDISPRWSVFAPLCLVAVAVAASLARWQVQGSGNLYTELAKRFYVPDPDLGWRVSSQHPIWLGLDACVLLVALALALMAATLLLRRHEHARQTRAHPLRTGLWMLGLASLGIPIAAFASGPGPVHGRDWLPASVAVRIERGIEGSLDAPDGAYVVVPHAGTAVTAHLSAGGEAFDARFTGVTGSWRGTPRDLRRPMHAQVDVATASIDTGVGKRTRHARERYLRTETFPRITVVIDQLAAVRANGREQIAFRAPGTLSLMGKTDAVEITGTVTRLDAAALARLDLQGEVLLVQADFSVPIRETMLAPDAHDFDDPTIPVHVSLVLRHVSTDPRSHP